MTITNPSVAVYVPRGVGNSHQTLELNTVYTYLVNDHWPPDATYTFLNLADGTAAVDWPIPSAEAILSDKDKAHPRMAQVTPFPAPAPTGKRVLVTGINGQLGRELMRQLPEAGYQTIGVDLLEVDVSDVKVVDALDRSCFDTIVNVAVWANVDGTESPEGRPMVWCANATGPANLAKATSMHGLALVHISTEYVLDGSCSLHLEDEAPSPLGVYVQAKAGGDTAVIAMPKHYLVRISWVVGDRKNFPRQMLELAPQGIAPQAVFDQTGCLTFTSDLAAGTLYFLETKAEYDTYNLSGEGPVASWVDIVKRVYELAGRDPDEIIPVSIEEYFLGREGVAPRPLVSALDLGKTKATGFTPVDSMKCLDNYARSLLGSKEG